MSANKTSQKWEMNKYGLAVHQVGDEGYKICDIRGWGHLTGGGALNLPHDEAVAIQKANGALIAAAPEMLEALEKLTDALFLYDEEFGYREEESSKTQDVLKAYQNALSVLKPIGVSNHEQN